MNTETQQLINTITTDIIKSHLPLVFLNPIPSSEDDWQIIQATNEFTKEHLANMYPLGGMEVTPASVKELMTAQMLESIPREFKKALVYGIGHMNVKSMFAMVGELGGQFEYYVEIDTVNTYLNVIDNDDSLEVSFKLVYTMRKHTADTLAELRAMVNG